MTPVQVFLDIFVHPRPVVALEQPFLCLEVPVVSGKNRAVGVLEGIGNEGVGEKKDHAVFFSGR